MCVRVCARVGAGQGASGEHHPAEGPPGQRRSDWEAEGGNRLAEHSESNLCNFLLRVFICVSACGRLVGVVNHPVAFLSTLCEALFSATT